MWNRIDVDGRACRNAAGLQVAVPVLGERQNSRRRRRLYTRSASAACVCRGSDQKNQAGHGRADSSAEASAVRRKRDGDARPAVERARDPRDRQRMARGGVHLAWTRLPYSRRAHRRGDQMAPRAVERGCLVVSWQALQFRAGEMLSEAGPERWRADSCRWSFAGGCEARGAIWRRFLPGAGGDSQAEGTVRADELRGREGRARSEEDRAVMHGARASGRVEGARGYRSVESHNRAARLRRRRPDPRAREVV